MATKRRYPREFKVEAVAGSKRSGKSIGEIERELGIPAGLRTKWKPGQKTAGEPAFPGQGRLKEADELIRRVPGESEVLRPEGEGLKKGLVIFSKGPP